VDVVALVGDLAACDPSIADRSQLAACADASTRIRAWLDAYDIELARGFEVTTGYGAKTFADAAGVSLSAGQRVVERGATLQRVTALEAAMKAGELSGPHVDAVTRALRQVPEARRAEFAARVDERVSEARSRPVHEYERWLRAEVLRILGPDRDKDAQKKSIRWRSWVDRISGLFRGDFVCDSLSAVKIDKRIQDEVDRLFAERVPDGCPEDLIEKQKYLAGLAVISLLTGDGGRGGVPGRPELVVVVDATQLDDDGRPTVDWGLPVDLPESVLREVAARARLHVVGVWPPADLNLGRGQRLASAAQRRVLRAIYGRCAIPDCPVRFSRTRIHHVWEWEHGGPTDLDNLLPLCSRHHTAVHDEGWKLKLLPDRSLEITLPSGETMTTGPPSRAP
jgi:hypothetical protein